MTMPGFTAESSLYDRRGRYALSGTPADSHANTVIPAIPACRNCDYILENCENNGWQPRAVCNACATHYCYGPDPWSVGDF
jgi:hypothetical protein